MDHGTDAFRAAVNARIADRAWRFGPVKVRTAEYRRPRQEAVHLVTDAKGRRMAIGVKVDPGLAADRLHNRHMKRVRLDHDERMARLAVDGQFEGLLRKPPRVMLADADEDHRNSFMCFCVEIELLDETLEWRSHLLDYRPYSSAGDALARFARVQRRRLKALGTRGRSEALTCCPVLASRIEAADNPGTWAELLEMALDGRADPGLPHFEDGRLVGVVEMSPGAYHAGRKGAWWRRDSLSVPLTMPDSLAQALRGRPLSSVMEHPHLPRDMKVRSVTTRGRRSEVLVRPAPIAFMPVYTRLLERAAAAGPR